MRAFWNKIGKTGVIDESSTVKKTASSANQQLTPPVRLTMEELCYKFNSDNLDIQSTAHVPVRNLTIGQDRALEAIEFGLNIKSKGFNIFACGMAGTGKDSAVLQKLSSVAKSEPVPDDICIFYNFSAPQSPKVLYFPAGSGKRFKFELQELLKRAKEKIKEVLFSEQYERWSHKQKNSCQHDNGLGKELKDCALSKKSDIKQTCNRKTIYPVREDGALSDIEPDSLSGDQIQQFFQLRQEIDGRIFQTGRTVHLKKEQLNIEIKQAEKLLISNVLDNLFKELQEEFRNIKGLPEYLNDAKKNLINHIQQNNRVDFTGEFNLFSSPEEAEKYEVNLLVDNSETDGAPVVVETNPSFYNLFGNIEYRVQKSSVTANHLCLQAGSVHRAIGGYLILEVEEILGDLLAWDAMKKMLRHGQIKIGNLPEKSTVFPVQTLKPQSLSVQLKVILTGDPVFYQTLYNNDDEFVRIFKVKADFSDQLSKTAENIDGLICFVARICNEENLRHCDKTAIACIIDYSSRLAEHKQRLSAQFSRIADLIREANYHASINGCSLITGEHVHAACEAIKFRCSTLEEKFYSLIEDSTLYLDTRGREIGQVNGVSIVNNGDYVFGVPSRITARTFIGSGSIINIEREVEMSGKLHAKGVLILSGYLGQTYAQDKPLALSASVCFEQHYEEIDGDSASSAELYCLMSSLSGVPIRQDIAVTGSVDQRGMIQPVGGINTKIEGFFKACQLKGLSGSQGMIIPNGNVKNLMLGDDVLEAVRQNLFHIYTVSTIEQGLQILTGKDPGKVSEEGSFQPDTIHFLVNQKLRDYASVVASYEKDQYL